MLALLAVCPAASAAAPSFAAVLIERSQPGCAPGQPCAHVVLRGLRVRQISGPAAQAVQRQLDWALAGEEGVGSTPSALASSFIDQFVSYRRRFPAAAPWFLERRVRLLSQRPGLLSFAVKTTRFSGGAHPSTDVRFLDLDPRTGAPVGLDDLLAPGAAERLRVLALQALRAAQVVPVGAPRPETRLQPTWDTSDEDDDEPELPGSVGVTADALLLAWDAYELGPYARGPQTVALELSRLRRLLRPDGPLGRR